jgi:long-chain acyl-CoA synthetase
MIDTLGDFYSPLVDLENREALRFFNGYRTRRYTYRELSDLIGAFSNCLAEREISKEDRVLLWGRNGPEWVICFWACVFAGIQVVPIDERATPRLARRIADECEPKLLVRGPGIDSGDWDLPTVSFQEILQLDVGPEAVRAELSPDDVVEIVYTSGTTGEPKGVVHRHRNLCANLRPFAKEIQKYRLWARPFQPIRILNQLPLSHMFGQSMGLFIPLVLGGAVVYSTEFHPASVVSTLKRERVSVLVAVPRLLKQLRDHLDERFSVSERRIRWKGVPGILEKWWRFRDLHAALGWKFWAIVAGGAQVSVDLEDFYGKAGLLLIQGYGLTETSPVVSVNHPFRARRGSIGTVLEGQEVKIAEDGELLVRGDSVVSEYLTQDENGNGWLHTGDIAEIDDEGRLYYKGRKKDVIVTSEGTNVFPQDVEDALRKVSGVKDAVAIGLDRGGGDEVHAVLLLRSGADPDEIVKKANRELESHQKIRGCTVWKEEDFPRTPSTHKIQRHKVLERVRDRGAEEVREPDEAPSRLLAILAEMTHLKASQISQDDRLGEDLGMTSLDRIDLLSRLQETFGRALDERTIAVVQTVADLDALVEDGDAALEEASDSRNGEADGRKTARTSVEATKPETARRFPRWSRRKPFRWFRSSFQRLFVFPLLRRYMEFSAHHAERLEGLTPPVLFAANHSSHLDTVAVVAALPKEWRRKLAPAVRQEYFSGYFSPDGRSLRDRLRDRFLYFLACLLFNVYPLTQRVGGIQKALQYTGELTEKGFCPLIFPEGRRTPDGRLLPFKPGAARIATRLDLPVVPVYIRGLFEIFPLDSSWPETGPITVVFGRPLRFDSETDGRVATRRLEKAFEDLKEEADALHRPS